MTISEQFVQKIQSLYDLSDDTADKMRAGADVIEKTLQGYAWHDIERAINNRYVNNDKSRPRLGQVKAVLQEWEHKGEIFKFPDPIPDAPRVTFPKTKIWAISRTFNKLMAIMVDCGVIAPEFPINRPTGTLKSLVDSGGSLILSPRRWLHWQVVDAVAARPYVFAKFKHLNFWEQVAIGVDAGLIKFRVRDWTKVAAQAPQAEIMGTQAQIANTGVVGDNARRQKQMQTIMAQRG